MIICDSFVSVILNYHSILPFRIDVDTRDVMYFWETGGCRKERISERIKGTVMPKKDQGKGQGIE